MPSFPMPPVPGASVSTPSPAETCGAKSAGALPRGIGEIHVGHGMPGTLGMPVALAVRPEKIEISKAPPPGDAGPNVFKGKVKEIAYFGAHNTFIVVASNGQRVKITEANTSRHDLSDITWEDEVYFWWSDTAGVVLRD